MSQQSSTIPTTPAPLAGTHVLVLGLGQSGLAMARWCARAGAQVTVMDTRAQPPQLAALQRDCPQARFIHGPMMPQCLQGGDIRGVFKSPGLTPQEIAPLIEAARTQGLWVGGELSLFSHALRTLRENQGYQPQVLAVTGTNGKTTVTALTGQLVERAGKRVAVAGNIGPSLLDTLAQRMDANDLPEVWVLELSSFQLQDAHGFEPTAATVLNITQDHLDWHGDMTAYTTAKGKVFGQHALMLLNRDDPLVMELAQGLQKAAENGPRSQRVNRIWQTFGAGLPQQPGDFGIEEVNGMAWLVRAQELDDARKPRRGVPTETAELHLQRLMPVDALRIRGRHNALNALSALALASSAGCKLATMLYGLREYRGEPHRVESVAVVNGVEYFDDSKGTNVGATVAALAGLGAERKLVVILGGDGKGQDFTPLASPVARYARSVVLIGRDAPVIAKVLDGVGVPLTSVGSLSDAVRLASAQAQAGDAVLLSPACASFDMFDNYLHRSQVFVETVQELAADTGVSLEQLG